MMALLIITIWWSLRFSSNCFARVRRIIGLNRLDATQCEHTCVGVIVLVLLVNKLNSLRYAIATIIQLKCIEKRETAETFIKRCLRRARITPTHTTDQTDHSSRNRIWCEINYACFWFKRNKNRIMMIQNGFFYLFRLNSIIFGRQTIIPLSIFRSVTNLINWYTFSIFYFNAIEKSITFTLNVSSLACIKQWQPLRS